MSRHSWLPAPTTPDHAALIPGCRDGDWTTFADFDLQVCLFDFQSVGGWPEYAARSKIVTELTSLVHGDHSDSDEFWDAMLAYAGPHDPVHHPPDYYSDEEKREWWESQMQTQQGTLDGAHFALPLGAWAKTSAQRQTVTREVRDFFDNFPELTVALYIYDLVMSALVYAVVDLLGLVADFTYDILEFLAVLFLVIIDDVVLAVWEALKWGVKHSGSVVTILVAIAVDTFEILIQFIENAFSCLFYLHWACSTTSEVYSCCDNWQLGPQLSCANPSNDTGSPFDLDIHRRENTYNGQPMGGYPLDATLGATATATRPRSSSRRQTPGPSPTSSTTTSTKARTTASTAAEAGDLHRLDLRGLRVLLPEFGL